MTEMVRVSPHTCFQLSQSLKLRLGNSLVNVALFRRRSVRHLRNQRIVLGWAWLSQLGRDLWKSVEIKLSVQVMLRQQPPKYSTARNPRLSFYITVQCFYYLTTCSKRKYGKVIFIHLQSWFHLCHPLATAKLLDSHRKTSPGKAWNCNWWHQESLGETNAWNILELDMALMELQVPSNHQLQQSWYPPVINHDQLAKYPFRCSG